MNYKFLILRDANPRPCQTEKNKNVVPAKKLIKKVQEGDNFSLEGMQL
jgi:hypothetical protein